MGVLDDVRRELSGMSREELAKIGRNRDAVERVMVRAVDDLGWAGAADLLISLAARWEARAAVE